MATNSFHKEYLEKKSIVFREENRKATLEAERKARNRIDTENKITEVINTYKNEETIKQIKEQLLKNLAKKKTYVSLNINLYKIMNSGWSFTEYNLVEYEGKYLELHPRIYVNTDKFGHNNVRYIGYQKTEDYFKDYNKDSKMLKQYIEDNIEGSQVTISVEGSTLTYTIRII